MDKIIIESKETPEYAFIWLHGLGASGNDLKALAENIPINWKASIKHLLPHAPEMPVTINNGMVMPAWYDVYTLSSEIPDNLDRIDIEGVKNSAEKINELIESEIRQGIETQKIYLIGFSQGGVICNYLGLTSKHHFGGIVGLSTYLPFDAAYFEKQDYNKENAFFIAHGALDSVIPFEIGKRSFDLLSQYKIDATFNQYQMDHGICQEEYLELATWIKLQHKKLYLV